MFTLTMFFAIILILMMIIINMIPVINIQKFKDREKMSPFECGFDPLSNPRISFSIQFFTISLMFLIFDIEITLLLPMPLILNLMNSKMWMLSMIILTFTLISGLILEWKEGSMNWK
uniref:NADH-ubiquinone oxidoreductase chain 3 n=1 Tax=Mesohomotoma hibisci TaxID=399243 RepID=A0A344A2K2_9HEMI|nr:NADH dehydrogenase subunit 3 [Mesohomotoma hibisci]